MSDKIVAYSKERYQASAAEKRQYGGATVTVFYVHFVSQADQPATWKEVKGFGPTPVDRKTDAIQRFKALM